MVSDASALSSRNVASTGWSIGPGRVAIQRPSLRPPPVDDASNPERLISCGDRHDTAEPCAAVLAVEQQDARDAGELLVVDRGPLRCVARLVAATSGERDQGGER